MSWGGNVSHYCTIPPSTTCHFYKCEVVEWECERRTLQLLWSFTLWYLLVMVRSRWFICIVWALSYRGIHSPCGDAQLLLNTFSFYLQNERLELAFPEGSLICLVVGAALVWAWVFCCVVLEGYVPLLDLLCPSASPQFFYSCSKFNQRREKKQECAELLKGQRSLCVRSAISVVN